MLRFLFRNHSNWSQIKKKKGELDLKKARIRTKITQSIQKAVKANGPDPSKNTWLNKCINEATKNDVPKNIIQTAIQKALRSGGGETLLFEARYKGYFFLIHCSSDNKLRTGQHIRTLVQDHEGIFYQEQGHVSWMFNKTGILELMSPMLQNDLAKIQKHFDGLEKWVYQHLQADGSLSKMPDPIEETIQLSAIPTEALMELAIDQGADDLFIMNYPIAELQASNLLPNLQTQNLVTPKYNLLTYLPPIEILRVETSQKELQFLKREFQHFEYKGHKPILLNAEMVWIPKKDDFSSESIWQPLEQEDAPVVSSLLEALNDHEDVVQVYHNIPGLDPWFAQ